MLEGGRSKHGDDGHAVHMVGDGFAVFDAEAAPAFALSGLEAGQHMEEVKRGLWLIWWIVQRKVSQS